MKKKVFVGVVVLALFGFYEYYLSAKVGLYFALRDMNEMLELQKNTLEETKSKVDDYEDLVDRHCDSDLSKKVDLLMLDDLASFNGNAVSSSILKENPVMTNMANYSRDFVIYHRLARLFPDSLEQIKSELADAPEVKELGQYIQEVQAIKPSIDLSNQDAKKVRDWYRLMMCLQSKVRLGLIGQDPDFTRNMKIIESELMVKNAQAAQKALEEITKSLN